MHTPTVDLVDAWLGGRGEAASGTDRQSVWRAARICSHSVEQRSSAMRASCISVLTLSAASGSTHVRICKSVQTRAPVHTRGGLKGSERGEISGGTRTCSAHLHWSTSCASALSSTLHQAASSCAVVVRLRTRSSRRNIVSRKMKLVQS
jgi:hypothetical protein